MNRDTEANLSLRVKEQNALWPRSPAGGKPPDAAAAHPWTTCWKQVPRPQQQLIVEGRLTEARASLRRVLARRQLTPSKDEDARIEACTDLTTLQRWHDQAVTAASVLEALG
jgi:hypothetical protein